MKIQSGLKIYLAAHMIVTGLLCALLLWMFVLHDTAPPSHSILHNIFAGEAEFDEVALLGNLILRVVHYGVFLKRRPFFRLLPFVGCILGAVAAGTAEYPGLSVAFLVLDAPCAAYALFSKTARQFAPFPFAKGGKTRFENWMYRHMAMEQFPQEDADDYLQEFQKAQASQYTPWIYTLAGQRTPLDEARGNALLYSFAFFVPGVICLALLAVLLVSASFRVDAGLAAGLVGLVLFTIIFFFIGWRYVQLHYRRRYAAKRHGAEARRKRKGYKNGKGG